MQFNLFIFSLLSLFQLSFANPLPGDILFGSPGFFYSPCGSNHDYKKTLSSGVYKVRKCEIGNYATFGGHKGDGCSGDTYCIQNKNTKQFYCVPNGRNFCHLRCECDVLHSTLTNKDYVSPCLVSCKNNGGTMNQCFSKCAA